MLRLGRRTVLGWTACISDAVFASDYSAMIMVARVIHRIGLYLMGIQHIFLVSSDRQTPFRDIRHKIHSFLAWILD